ncbi:MAG TPA: hypothetical protein VFA09_27660 [Ktedonobacteraceae bacterium]|nr:hypothetical protein [Ktedonobacteraceae bacterium]
MSEEQTQEGTRPEVSTLLQSRPQRRSRRGLALLLFLLGGVVMVSVVAFIAWQALSLGSNTTGTGAVITPKGNTNGGSAVPPGWNDPATYWDPIRTTVAQGLHLSVAQVTTRLQAASLQSTSTPISSNKGSPPDPGAAMTALAVQQGLSIEQLRTLELNALQKGCDAMVAQGKLSQAEASQRMQTFNSWDQGTLNWYVIHAFTGQ